MSEDAKTLRALLKAIVTRHSVADFNSALRYLYETDGDYRSRVISDQSGVVPPLPGYEPLSEAAVSAIMASKGQQVNFIVTLKESSVKLLGEELVNLRRLYEKLEHLEGMEEEAQLLKDAIDNIENIHSDNC